MMSTSLSSRSSRARDDRHDQAPALEERGVPGADLPENPVDFYFVTKGSENAMKSLIAKIRHHLKAGSRPQTPSPQAVIYDLDGDVLARVPLDQEHD